VVSVLRGNGDGTFQAPVDYLVGAGSHSLAVGDFNGDGKPDLAVGNSFSFDVSVLLNTSPAASTADPVATTTTLAVSGPAVFGQQVTVTATVTAANGTPTGTVMFFDGATPLGEVAVDPNGQATFILPLGVGVHSLTATFAGIAPFTDSSSAAVSETVNKAATMTALAAEVICQNFDGSAEVLLTANVVPVAPGAGVPTGTVTFFDGTRVLGTVQLDAHGQAYLDVSALPRGTHSLTATFSGDGNFLASTSDPFVLTIP
jgi:Bacterial Ig-like domain (group 3)/FG-GAP repeat